MEYAAFQTLFCNAMAENGLSMPDDACLEQFYRFTLHLLEVNQHTNLTAIRRVDGVITKHLIDSLLISDLIPRNAEVLDLGCGPGFPSIPLAIFRPDLRIVALDSTAKKIEFVRETAEILTLRNLQACSGRAEDHEMIRKLGTFDVVTSRAVAALQVLCELCMPYVKIGGEMIAMKGAKIEEELAILKNGRILRLMGGDDATCCLWTLKTETESEQRGAVLVKKMHREADGYPRSYATILKKPL